MIDPPTETSYAVEITFGGQISDINAAAVGVNGTVGTYEVDSTATDAEGGSPPQPSISWSTTDTNTIGFNSFMNRQSTSTKVSSDDTGLFKTDAGQDTLGAAYAIWSSSGSQTLSWTDTDNDEYWGLVAMAFAETIATPLISESDNVNVGESHSVVLDDLEISVSDNTGVTDANETVYIERPEPSVSDNTGVTDTLPTVFQDNVTLGESVNVEVVAAVPPRTISVSDNTGVTDTNQEVDRRYSIPFSDGFESGDVSAWDSESGTVTVNATAAMEGSYGVEIDLNDEYVTIDWNNTTDQIYRVLFRFNQNNYAGAAPDNVHLLQIYDGDPTVSDNLSAIVQLYYNTTVWSIRVQARRDDKTWVVGAHNNIGSGDLVIEAEFGYLATNGYARLWIDGVEVNGASSVDNGGYYPDNIRFGHVESSPTPDSGTAFLDDFNLLDTVREYDISVSDNTGVGESHAVSTYLEISVSDNTGVGESHSAALEDLEISVSDNTGVGESHAVFTYLEISVSDNTGVTDTNQEVDISAAGDYDITVSDNTGVGESHEVFTYLEIAVSDNTGVGESHSVYIPEYFISVSDNVNIGESHEVFTYLEISTSDNVNVGESHALNVPGYSLEISVSDNTGVADSTTVVAQVAGELYIVVSDNTGVGESHEVFTYLEISVSDNTGIGESHAVLTALNISVSDNVGVTDLLRVIYIPVGQTELIDMEEGDMTDWDSTTGDDAPTATTGSKIVGSYGMEQVIDDTGFDYATHTLGTYTQWIRGRFYLDINSFGSGVYEIEVLKIGETLNTNRIVRVDLESTGSQYNIKLLYFRDSQQVSGFTALDVGDGVHEIQFAISRATTATSSDATAAFWFDGAYKGQQGSFDNYDVFAAGMVSMFAGNITSTSETGTLYFDDFILRDDNEPITPAILFISVSDNTGVGESHSVNIPEYNISVSDNTGVGESYALNVPDYSFNISVSDNTGVGESHSVATSGGLREISVSDNVTIADAVGIVQSIEFSVSDNVTVTDNFDRVRLVGPFDGLIPVTLDPRGMMVSLASRSLEADLDPRTPKIKLNSK
jgi:hypothetical protein